MEHSNVALDLVFFNEAAERIIGRRLAETGKIRRGEWTGLFRPTDEQRFPIPREEQPLARAIDKREPAYTVSWLQGLDGVERHIEGLAFPLEDRQGRLLGAVGVFWELQKLTSRPEDS